MYALLCMAQPWTSHPSPTQSRPPQPRPALALQAHVLEIIERLFSDRTCFTIAHR